MPSFLSNISVETNGSLPDGFVFTAAFESGYCLLLAVCRVQVFLTPHVTAAVVVLSVRYLPVAVFVINVAIPHVAFSCAIPFRRSSEYLLFACIYQSRNRQKWVSPQYVMFLLLTCKLAARPSSAFCSFHAEQWQCACILLALVRRLLLAFLLFWQQVSLRVSQLWL